MTVTALFDYVRGTRDNAFKDAVLLQWTNEVEATIQTDVMLLDVSNVKAHTELTESLVADAAHTKLYWMYLYAMICYANNEFKKYQDYVDGYNQALREYSAWYAMRYNPAGGAAETAGYYISAYSLAVKHGFSGTEDEWIAAVEAARTSAESSATAAANALSGAEAAKTAAAASETAAAKSAADASSAASGVSQYVSAAQSAAADAATAKTAAAASQSAAASSATAAASSASAAAASQTAAEDSKTRAATSETEAGKSASAAAESATAAKASETAAGTSETNAKASETAAKTSETNAKASETAAGGSASDAAASQSAASASASAAAASQTAAAGSEANSAASAKAAAESAQQASAGQVNSDWNVADSTNKAYIKNKPTALPASDVAAWAKEATKPAYTAEEVGADASGAASTAASAALTAAGNYTDTKTGVKADKTVPAAEGNLAALDAGGNLVDSKKKPTDFAAAAHASTHKTGGSDPLTATDVGAYTKAEVDASLVEKAELNYTLYQRTMTVEQLNACSPYPYMAALGTPSASFGPRPDYWDVEYHYYDANTGLQIITALVTGDRWYRVFNAGTARAWQQIATCTPPTAYDLPLSSGCSASNLVKYIKSNDGVVTVYGQISSGSSVNSQKVVATLPAGYRPSADLEYPCTDDAGSGACLISSSGSISVIPSGHYGTYFRIFASFVAGN